MELNNYQLSIILKAYFELEKNMIIGELINKAYDFLPQSLKIEPTPPVTKMRQIRYFVMTNYLEIQEKLSNNTIEKIQRQSFLELQKLEQNKNEIKDIIDDKPLSEDIPKQKKQRKKRITKYKSKKK